METTKNGNPIRLSDRGAVVAGNLHEFLEALPSGDHVDDVAADLDDELLRQHDPRAEAVAEGVAAEVVVAVEADAGHALVEVDELPHCVERDAPRQHHHQCPRTPTIYIYITIINTLYNFALDWIYTINCTSPSKPWRRAGSELRRQSWPSRCETSSTTISPLALDDFPHFYHYHYHYHYMEPPIT